MRRPALAAIWRLARRDLRRSPLLSVLMVAMIALPVAAMVAGSILFATQSGTPDQRAAAQMGRADLRLDELGTPSGEPRQDEAVAALMPTGSRIEPVGYASTTLTASGGTFRTGINAADLRGLAAGTYPVLAGRAPVASDEVALSSTALASGNLVVGDLADLGSLGTRLVVGEVVDADATSVVTGVVAPEATIPSTTWLVDLPPEVDAATTATDLADGGAGLAVTTRAQAAGLSDNQAAAVLVLGGVALVEAALVVSASFAVSLRRRQRDLGLLAVGGADPRHLRASVWTSGLAVGAAGTLVGLAVGLVGIRLALSWIVERADRVVTGLVVPPTAIVVPVALGIAAAVVAALVPARGAARMPVAMALANRRPPTRPSRGWAVAGLALAVAGVGCVVATTTVLASLRLPDGLRGLVIPGGILLGSVLAVLGAGAASPWMLERLGRVAPRLPLGLRLSVRDTGRFRTRNGPVVTAVVAGLAGSVALGTVLGSLDLRDRAAYTPMLDTDQVLVVGPEATIVADRPTDRLDAMASTPLRRLEGGDPDTVLSVDTTDGGQLDTVVGDAATVRAMGGDAEAVAALDRGEVVAWSALPSDTVDLVAGTESSPAAERTTLPVFMASTSDVAQLPDAVVSAATLAAAGADLSVAPIEDVLVRLAGPIDTADADAARSIAAGQRRPPPPSSRVSSVGPLPCAVPCRWPRWSPAWS